MFDKLRFAVPALLAGAAATVYSVPCFAQVTLPPTGVDIPDHIDAVVTALGLVVLSAAGAYFAFLLVRKGINWARRFAG